MPARDRRGAQLAIQIPPELLARLKTYAGAQQRPMAELLRRWIEAGLAGALDGPIAAGTSPEVEQRLQALEAAVKALQREPRSKREIPSPEPAKPVTPPQNPNPPKEAAKIPQSVEAKIPQSGEVPDGAITTAELALMTGTNRAAWNNWARDKSPGAVRKMPAEVGQWRLAGKAPTEAGGPPRWLWERA